MRTRTVLCMGLVVSAAGCGSSSPRPAPAQRDAVNTGLANLTSDAPATPDLLGVPDPSKLSANAKATLAARAAADLEAFLNPTPTTEGAAPPPEPNAGEADAPPPQPATPSDPSPPPPDVLAQANAAWAASPPAEASAPERAAPSAFVPADDPLLDLAQRMAKLLREAAGGAKIADAVALAPLEALHPGILADLESASNPLGARLGAEDRRVLIEARDRVLRDPAQAGEALRKGLAKITPAPTISIARAALCRKVDGFGRYEAFPTDTWIAGRPIRMIVYVELEGFSTRPARDGDPAQPKVSLSEQVSVELTQSLTLYHESDGLQAWHRPAQRVIETARTKKRDFYLVHQVDLPATLTIGKYVLKATVTDVVTGAADEVNLPVRVVAEPPITTRR